MLRTNLEEKVIEIRKIKKIPILVQLNNKLMFYKDYYLIIEGKILVSVSVFIAVATFSFTSSKNP